MHLLSPWAQRYLESLRKKLTSRVALLRRLAGSSWSNNSVNSYPSPGPFNCRVQSVLLFGAAMLIPASSTLPSTTPCELWPDACVLHQQPFNPRRHPTCWASSHWRHTVSSTPCHVAWTSGPLSAYPSIECKRTAPKIETSICTWWCGFTNIAEW